MLRLRLLGPIVVELDGRVRAPPRSAPSRWLLAWLALHAGPQPRATLASRFWPDVLDENARQSLRNALYGLRRDLGPAAAAVRADGATLALDDAVAVDVRELDAALDGGDAERAVALADRGELLAGVEQDWALQAREERAQRLDALLAGRIATATDARDAIGWARRRARADPLCEEAARDLMGALADAGDRAAALAVYERFAERLRRELRVAPSNPTRDLERELRTPAPLAPWMELFASLLAELSAQLPSLEVDWTLEEDAGGTRLAVHASLGRTVTGAPRGSG